MEPGWWCNLPAALHYRIKIRSTDPRLVGDRELQIGPKGNPFIGLWTCPLHRHHVWFRLPFTRKVFGW